jgi:hypothetical protein
MWTYEDLMKLTPDEFERVLADLWCAMGYTVTVVGGPGDKGIDILAVMERGVPFTVGIQAKCYGPTNKVGVREIREYASLLAKREVDSIIVVCTSGFTEEALREAKDLNVKTINGGQLLELLNQHKVSLPVQMSFMPSAQSSVANEKREPPALKKGAEKQKPKLGHAEWAITLLLLGIGGFISFAEEGFNAGMFVFALFSFLIGLGLGVDYLTKQSSVRELQNGLNLSKDEAQTLVIRGFDSISKIATTNPETLALHLGCDVPKAYEIIQRARTSPKRVEENITKSSLVTSYALRRILAYVKQDERPIGVIEGKWGPTSISCILLFTDFRIIVAESLRYKLIAIGNPQRPIDVQITSERYANITFEDVNGEKKHSVLKVSRPHLEKILQNYQSLQSM